MHNRKLSDMTTYGAFRRPRGFIARCTRVELAPIASMYLAKPVIAMIISPRCAASLLNSSEMYSKISKSGRPSEFLLGTKFVL